MTSLATDSLSPLSLLRSASRLAGSGIAALRAGRPVGWRLAAAVVLVLAAVLDHASTEYVLSNGLGVEANPGPAAAMELFGSTTVLTVGTLICVSFALTLLPVPRTRSERLVQVVALGLMVMKSAIVVWNVAYVVGM